MTNKITMDRELVERIVKTCPFTLLELDYQELRAALAEQPQEDAQPVALPDRMTREKAMGLSDYPPECAMYWWNTCLDEIAKLGPLYTHPAPVQQREPLGWVRPQALEAFKDVGWVHVFAAKGGDDSAVAVYTHADPGEVDRLRSEIKLLKSDLKIANDTTALGVKMLAERDALLSEMRDLATAIPVLMLAIPDPHDRVARDNHIDAVNALIEKCDDALSASAEPNKGGDL